VGEHVKLTRRGRNFIGLCPFHQEKTPSFIVSPDKNIYKCFGCGKGGNSVTFIMDFNSFSFSESIEYLAGKYGVDLPKDSKFDQEKDDKRDLLFRALSEAANYYHKLLYTKEGKETLAYFRKRNFDDNTISKFLLGHSPNSSANLYNYLKELNYHDDILVSNGLIYKNDNGKSIDRFRDRAMFPIRDFIGRVVGFGARFMGEDKSQAKYINSPQNEIYDKSRVLFGLFEAKNEIRHKSSTILTEGYADVITMSQAGILNVVASSGTALSTQQLQLLKRFANKIYICYDSDEAGQKAAETAAETALTESFDTKIIVLPQGEDPDSLVKSQGEDAFDFHLRKALNYVEFKLNRIKEKDNLSSPVAITNALKNLLNVVAKIPDEIQHDFYIKDIANRLALSENQLKQAYILKNKLQKDYMQQIESSLSENFEKAFEVVKENESKDGDVLNLKDLFNEEIKLLRTALQSSDNLLHIFEYTDFTTDTLITGTARKLFEIITLNSEEGNILNSILLGDQEQIIKDIFLTLSIESESPSENWYTKMNLERHETDNVKIIKDSIVKLKKRKLKIQIDEVMKQIKQEPDNPHNLQRLSELKRREMELSN